MLHADEDCHPAAVTDHIVLVPLADDPLDVVMNKETETRLHGKLSLVPVPGLSLGPSVIRRSNLLQPVALRVNLR